MTEEQINTIKKIRETTGIKLMKAKKAFCDADGNYEKALELIKNDTLGAYSGVERLITYKPIKSNDESEEIKMSEKEVKKQCCGESMVGRCDCCGKENMPLQRKYFRYPGIPCECHSPEHFIIRNHCANCIPREPEYSNVNFRTDDLKTPAAIAMKMLRHSLKEDKSEGSYYYSWQANIACNIMDHCKNVSHEDANKAAKAFLELLIG